MFRVSTFVLCLLGSHAAVAGDLPNQSVAQRNEAGFLSPAGPTLAPFQHVRFCLRYTEDCQSTASTESTIDATPEMLAVFEKVNRRINAAIAPREKSYGGDVNETWTINSKTGDCNDYAVSKRHELLKLGLPSNVLLLAVVRTESGIGHLVLVVRTSKGDIVLDNLRSGLRSWQSANYEWLKLQSAENPRYWREIVRRPIVTAVNTK